MGLSDKRQITAVEDSDTDEEDNTVIDYIML